MIKYNYLYPVYTTYLAFISYLKTTNTSPIETLGLIILGWAGRIMEKGNIAYANFKQGKQLLNDAFKNSGSFDCELRYFWIIDNLG